MPSRRVVVLVFAFWMMTLGLAFYRDLWPRLSASGPPPIAIDLVDEATPNLQVRWSVVRGDQKIGKLTTRMVYVEADDSVKFVHQYYQIEIKIAGQTILIPELSTTTRVTRAGELREQSMEGKMGVLIAGQTLEAHAKVAGRVENGAYLSHCWISHPVKFDRELDPIPVPEGQALTPLQPVNRIANVRPGQTWAVREIDPLRDAIASMLRKEGEQFGLKLPEPAREPLIAEVLSSPQVRNWADTETSCWVIEYRGRAARARTWVRVTDGKVLRQEAIQDDDRIALERED